ncbi:MAG: HDOD domain-containing protein [Myxococcales bacterium]|nr:HDOD domain-containing protein [Myxococcales bacterium]MDD9971087.1 HDOD domain-containing protein [Myxococcales bacterium]
MSQAVNVVGLQEKLQALLVGKIEGNKLVLPAIPTTAAKTIEVLENSELDIGRVTQLLEGDPVLSLDVLRLVNSSAFAPKVPIESIARAVSMLGAKRLRTFLITSSARQIFVSRIPEVREIFSQLWTHSVGVAVASRQIAVHAGFEDKEAPYMAGLMHDIGKPIVGIHLLELEKSVSRWQQSKWIDPAAWLSIVEATHRAVGIAVAKKWKLSAQVCDAIEDCVEYDPGDRLSAANAVRFANALAKREGVCVGDVDMEQVNTVLMIGRSILGLEEEAVDGMSSALHEAVREFG